MSAAVLLAAYERWSAAGKALVLASVFATEGSTYSKTGAQMLITEDGEFQGMLSGGCLEGDLAERARAVVGSGMPQVVTYDLSQDDEELWGMGVGCDGLMRIFLQPLRAANGYQPFATMARALAGDSEQVAATVIESGIDGLLPGATLATLDGAVAYSDVPEALIAEFGAMLGSSLLERRSACKSFSSAAGEARLLFTLLAPPPAILVLGAGLDAGPVVRFAIALGWRVTVQDHRPAYIDAGSFGGAAQVHCVPVDELSKAVDLNGFAAVIVMSHHLASDRSYLGQIARSRIPYVGLLGPAQRRRRLLDELGAAGKRLEGRLHGPAGLDIGGRGPASIALSIIAEIHQELLAAG